MKDTYQFDANHLTIQDPDLGIDIDVAFSPLRIPQDCAKAPHLVVEKDSQGKALCAYFQVKGHLEGEYLLYYPNGKIEMECFYLNGKLHGPSKFYSEDGICVSKTWFYQNHREGKSIRYYLSGKLCMIERYKKGKRQGRQEYYYENGALKSEMTYSKEGLEGCVKLYWPNKQKKREVFFEKGMREGLDRMWNEKGILTDEGVYQKGNPIGFHYRFSPEGSPLEERYYHSPRRYDQKKWDQNGNLSLEGKYDPFLQYVEKSWKDGVESTKVGKWDGQRIQWRCDAAN